jgi:predicted kinase
VIDATNLRRKDRIAHAAFAPDGVPVRYIVCNRPMEVKQQDGGWRNGVMINGVSLIERHEQIFNSQLADILAGDHLPNVTVLDKREAIVE